MLCPATYASPEVGSMIPQRRRMVVVFPAPSGPTRPNSSPFGTSRESSIKCGQGSESFGQGLQSQWRSWILHFSLPERGGIIPRISVGRHPGLQLAVWVLDIHFDPIDELHPFLLGLDLLGCKFGFRGDEGDFPLGLVGKGICLDTNLLAQLHPT